MALCAFASLDAQQGYRLSLAGLASVGTLLPSVIAVELIAATVLLRVFGPTVVPCFHCDEQVMHQLCVCMCVVHRSFSVA